MGLEIKCETKLYIIIIILYCSGNADEKGSFFLVEIFLKIIVVDLP